MMRFRIAAMWAVSLVGVASLGGCVVGMNEHDRVVTELTLVRQQQEETRAEHNREMQALTARLKTAESDNKKLTEQVASLGKTNAEAAEKAKAQQTQIEKLQGDLKDKTVALDKLSKAAKLQDKLVKDQAEEIQKLKDEIALLKKAAAEPATKSGEGDKIEPVESK